MILTSAETHDPFLVTFSRDAQFVWTKDAEGVAHLSIRYMEHETSYRILETYTQIQFLRNVALGHRHSGQ